MPRKKPKEKEVKKVWFENDSAEVGEDGVQQITPYLEIDGSLWIAVYENGEIARKINGNIVKYIDC